MAPDDEATRQFAEAFQLSTLTVHATDDWTLSVRPAQPVVGALVLSTRHGALSFSDVPATARAGLVELAGQAEEAAKRLFGAVRLNALCLMMKDPLFHFHLLPRYAEAVELSGHPWVDTGWPGAPDLAADQAQGVEDLRAVLQAYRSVDWV